MNPRQVCQPLFLLDPGWLFIGVGMVVIAAVLLIPAAEQRHAASEQQRALAVREQLAIERLRSYSQFLAALDSGDVQVQRRLAAAQLNLVPTGMQMIVRSRSATDPVTAWIDDTITLKPYNVQPFPQSTLVALAGGKSRQWMLGGAGLCLFVGLLVRPSRG